MEWARQFDLRNRHVADEQVGDARVSTVFLGIDHGFPWLAEHENEAYRPVLFETMIFGSKGGKFDDYQTRCCTWDEAEDMHEKAVNLVLRRRFRVVK